ncbi:cytochrome b-c1 complex subunit 9 [Gaertneriomyces semiglobifer]|nr:cytochrome b-c1 complex subunit 9 [Gaertneriomyces semiglobifer]
MASALARTTYNVFFKKSSNFVAGIFAAAFAFEIAFDSVTDRVWDSLNRGRQWKDIRDKYIQ